MAKYTILVCSDCGGQVLNHLNDLFACVACGKTEQDMIPERVEVVPKELADELAEMLAIYDEADYLPHGRVTNALTAYREALSE